MKILYIASGTGMAGGATKSFISMILQLRTYGLDIEVICPDKEGLFQWLKENGIKVHFVHYRHAKLPRFGTLTEKIKWLPRLLHDSWINHRAKSAVAKLIKASAPDIIHENSSVLNIGYQAAKSLGVPDVVHVREYGNLDFGMILPGRSKRLYDPNTYTISITKDIKRHVGLDSSDQAVQIYDGILSTSDFRLNVNKERWMLFAGRIESAKGLDYLLEAYVEYSAKVENPMPLLVCGGCSNPDYLEALKNYVEDKGVGSKVAWMGERNDVADFMYRTAVTIVPSRFEGLGRVLPEAMSNGSLCIGRYTGGTKEQIDNGLDFTGAPIAMSFTEKSQLRDALVKITNEYDSGTAFLPDGEYMQMIGRAQKTVREFFSVESFGEKVMDFYNKILTSRKLE